MGDLPKLAWSRDVTGKVDNIHSNLTPAQLAMLPFDLACFFSKIEQIKLKFLHFLFFNHKN